MSPAPSASEFMNQDGQQVSFDSLKGKYVVLADFLSLCQEICPLTSANFAAIQQRIAAAGLGSQVELVEVTVDPARDSPARLKAYQALYGAASNWEFLTGTAAQIAQLWDSLGVSYQKVGEDPGVHPIDWWTGRTLTFDVNHADVVFILGPDGHQKWLIQGPPNAVGRTLPAKLQQFLNANGHTNQASPPADSWTSGQVVAALSYVTGHHI